MSTDCEQLRRLISVPPFVEGCEWQTGRRAPAGEDWWLAAVLIAKPGDLALALQGSPRHEVIDTPPGLSLTASFAALSSLPGATHVAGGGVRLVTSVYDVAPFARSPLLHGGALRLGEDRALVMLWTR